VTLECAIPAYPAPEKVQWFRNEVEIFTSPDYTISFSVGLCTLVIAEVFPEDSGTYRCMVTVNGVPNSTTMRLQVGGLYTGPHEFILSVVTFSLSQIIVYYNRLSMKKK